MSQVLRWKTVKTRKPHKCSLCNREMPAGTAMVSAAWADAGTVFSEKFCLPCESYWKNELPGEEIYLEGETIYGDNREKWEEYRARLED